MTQKAVECLAVAKVNPCTQGTRIRAVREPNSPLELLRDGYRMEGSESYSSIEHIAMALHFGRWEETLFAMLTAYFDASGGAEQHSVVIAGFVQTANNWVEFEREWRVFLDRYQVPYLHMSEFAHSTGRFKKWKEKEHEPTRRAFMKEALTLINEHGCWSFATVVVSEDFNQIVQELNMGHLLGNAYTFAASCILSYITAWCDEQRMNQPMEYIFEKGDAKQGVLRGIMERNGLPAPIFRPKQPEDSQVAIAPLQASDFLAYEVRRGYKDLVEKKLDFRHPLKQFDLMSGKAQWGFHTKKDLYQLLAVSDTTRKLEAIVKSRENDLA